MRQRWRTRRTQRVPALELSEDGALSDLVNGWQGGCIRVGDVTDPRAQAPWNSNHLTRDANLLHLELYANRPIDYVLKHEVGASFT